MAQEAIAEGLPSGVVTFLLTDIESSTALWDLDAVAMAAALESHDRVLRENVARNHGILLKSKGEGDSTMSVFQRAADAAAAARDARAALTGMSWPAGGLRVRMGIHTGEAQLRDGDYFGPSVNRTARIRDMAAGGQVLVSALTRQFVLERGDHDLTLADRGHHELRGLSRPEHVFELVDVPADVPAGVPADGPVDGAPATSSDVEVPFPAGLRPARGFVGRVAEMEALRAAWAEASAGRASGMFVVGEPGAGKTQLAAQFADEVAGQGGLVLYGRCDEQLSVPFQPFAEAFAAYLAAVPTAALSRRFGRMLPELARVIPSLARRIGARPATRADPESERYRLFRSATELVGEMTATRPVLLVLDDLHWATSPTLLLLRHLLGRDTEAALLIVGTYRDTELGRHHPLADTLAELRRVGRWARIHLDGLSPEELIDLLETLAGERLGDGARALAQVMAAATDGNPFFVTEVLRHLTETQVLYQQDGHWNSRATTVQELGLPEGVREVIGRRLLRLSESCNRMLSVGAVAGDRFSLHLLEHVPESGKGDEVLDALEEAVRARVLVEIPDAPGQFGFAHALLRQTLFVELSTARRLRLHRRVADALALLQPDDLDRIAFHYAESSAVGQPELAVTYGRQAAAAAVERAAYEQAVIHLERVLQVLDLADANQPDADRPLLLSELADAQWRAGDAAASKRSAEQAASAASAVGDHRTLAKIAVMHSRSSVWGQPDPASDRLGEEALAGLGEDEPALRAEVLAAMSYYRASGEGQNALAIELATTAVELARRCGDRAALADALYSQGIALLGDPAVDLRLTVAEELVHLGEDGGDADHEARGLRLRGTARLEVGDRAGFDDDLVRLTELGRRLGSWLWQANAAEWRVMVALMEARYDEVDALAADMIAAARNDPNFLNVYGGQIVFSRREQGRGDEVFSLVETAAEANPGLPTFKTVLALLLTDVGRLDVAADQLTAMLADDLAGFPRDISWPTSLCVLSEVCALAGTPAQSQVLYDHLLPFSGQGAVAGWGISWLGAYDRYLGMTATAAGDPASAERHLVAAMSMEERVGSLPAQVHTRYYMAKALLSRGDPAAVDAGAALLAEVSAEATRLGMGLKAAQASALLAGLAPRA
ncbi:MAG TPA: AAA family ATPase [Acidimicrobiales bacterium]|nr:AAA family ATPase [Acidimicrobiales bacterium]